MLFSDRYTRDEIEVTRETGTRGSDGLQATGTDTVLLSTGDAQQIGLAAEETPGSFGSGDVRFYATDSVLPCEPGDDATIATEEGRTFAATVERTQLDANMILLSYDR